MFMNSIIIQEKSMAWLQCNYGVELLVPSRSLWHFFFFLQENP